MSLADILQQASPAPAWSDLNVAGLKIGGVPVEPAVPADPNTLAYYGAGGILEPNPNVTVTSAGAVSTTSSLAATSLTVNSIAVPVNSASVSGTWVSADFTSSPSGTVTATQCGGTVVLGIATFTADLVEFPAGLNLVFSGSLPSWAYPSGAGNLIMPTVIATGGAAFLGCVFMTGSSLQIAPFGLSGGTWTGSTSYLFYRTSVAHN